MPKYKRILLKLSGEALMGDQSFGISPEMIKYVAEEICKVAQTRGIDINMYRLGLITGDTKRGKNDGSQWFGQLLEASMRLGVLFKAKGFDIPVTPVDLWLNQLSL